MARTKTLDKLLNGIARTFGHGVIVFSNNGVGLALEHDESAFIVRANGVIQVVLSESRKGQANMTRFNVGLLSTMFDEGNADLLANLIRRYEVALQQDNETAEIT